jgi:hypothetical protein
MAYLLVEHCCDTECIPSKCPRDVSQNANTLCLTCKRICYAAYSRAGCLNIRSALVFPRYFRWTLSYSRRASPLRFNFFLNVKSKPIHPAPSLRAAHDQAIYDCTLCGSTSNVCPTGTAGRVISDSLVVRLRPFDGVCKARFAVRGRTLKLFIARAMNSLHGSFDFRWGEKPSRIFVLLAQAKNRNSRSCAGAHSFPCATGVAHSSEKFSRLNALRVAERNFTCEAL